MRVIVYLTLLPIVVSAVGEYCPYEKCFCLEGTIDCENMELTSVPDVVTGNETFGMFLSLTNNDLTTIGEGRFPPGLYGIDFGSNPVTDIDMGAFSAIAESLIQLLFSQAHFSELPRAFLTLNDLQELTIGDTNIETYDDDVVKHIGQTLQSLIMSNVGLKEWPSWIQYLVHLGTLSLTNMDINVPDNGLDNQASTLFSLNLENCSLVDIPKALFNLSSLQYLVMDSNKIVNLTTLPYWPKITTLSLDKNQISDAGMLSESLRPIGGSLQTLQLSENKLTSVPDFSAMTALNSVYLTQNDITDVGSGKMPPYLDSLMMEFNHLRSLSTFMRTGLRLTVLRFSSNLITDLYGPDIPVSVSDMDVGLNLISKLTDTSFPENSSMATLKLDFNPLTDISSAAFNSLKKLTFLSLVATQITRLPIAMMALSSLKAADLGGNVNLVCTCLEKGLQNLFIDPYFDINGDCGLTSITYFINVLSDGCPS